MSGASSRAASVEELVGRVADEFQQRLQRGEWPDVEDYARRYPEIADVIRRVFPGLREVRRLGDGPGETAAAPPGTGVLGDYRIVREVGRGGMGVVYEAEQISLGRRVALKVLPFAATMDPRQLVRFHNEARAAASLDHPHIVKVHAVGCERGVHYYAMQFIDGQTLEELIRALQGAGGGPSGPPSHATTDEPVGGLAAPSAGSETVRGARPATEGAARDAAHFRRAAEWGAQAAEALEHAHALGIVHRDVKPANLMVDARGKLWVTDFGLAHTAADPGLTLSGDLLGTLRYMSPEQALAKHGLVGHRSDLYSLGVTLYELLTLRPAAGGRDRHEVLRQIAFEEPPPPRRLDRAIPAELETIVLKAVAKNPAERYGSAQELADDLWRFLRDEPIRARRPTPVQRARRWARRHRPVVWSATVSALLLLVMAVTGLAVSTVLISREKDQALGEHRRAKHRLLEARLAQARASRHGRQAGQRFDSWKALAEASALARELGLGEEQLLQLRDEAVACLALSDLRPVREWQGWPPGSSSGLAFDGGLRHYARSDGQGNVSVRRVADDRELVPLPGDGPGGPKSGAATMEFSPDGRLLAVRYWHRFAGAAANFWLWDWRGRRVVLQPSSAVESSAHAFSPDGRLLALALADGTLTVYEADGGKVVTRAPLNLAASHLAFSPDGKLAVAGFRARAVQVREAATGKLLRTLSTPGGVRRVAWHPDGTLLAAGCEDSHIHLWEAATGRRHAVLRGHRRPVVRVAFVPGADAVVSSAWDGTSRLWDALAGRELVSFVGEVVGVRRDGRRLATQDGSGLAVWEVAPGREYRALARCPDAEEQYEDGDFSPDGWWLAVGTSRGARLWDLAGGTGAVLLKAPAMKDAKFHPSGGELFTSGPAGLYRWPVRQEEGVLRVGPARRLPVPGPQERLSLDRDGRTLAVAGGWAEGGGRVLDPEGPAASVPLLRHGNAAFVAASPDGRWVATGTIHGFGVSVWEVRGGKRVAHLEPDERVTRVVFSPDGQWLVISTAGEFSVWEAGTWRPARRMRPGKGAAGPGCAAFSPDGKVLALAGPLDAVQLIDPATGRTWARLQAPDRDPIGWAGFSPDGTLLVVSTPAGAGVWDLRRARERLAEIGLDWDLPPYPPAPPAGRNPLRVEVDLGELAPAAPSP